MPKPTRMRISFSSGGIGCASLLRFYRSCDCLSGGIDREAEVTQMLPPG